MELVFPRLVYRGHAPEKGEQPDPVETKRVESQDDLDAALSAGWRLHRANDPKVADVDEPVGVDDEAKPKKGKK